MWGVRVVSVESESEGREWRVRVMSVESEGRECEE